ncbi:MAG TPA: hypothetical protein VFR10_11405 [bacterium]|nr:hypothetical protein [bacterium]
MTEREPDARDIEPINPDVPQVARIDSKIPWLILGSIVLFALWFPTSLDLGSRPPSAREVPWLPDPSVTTETTDPTSGGDPASGTDAAKDAPATDSRVEDPAPPAMPPSVAARDEVSLPRAMNDLAMRSLAKHLDPVMAFGEGAQSDHLLAAARRLSNLAALIFLLVYFSLGRRVIGNAAALVAASLLAVTGPFVEAARSAHPLLLAEALALAGVAWMIGIEARHREVGYTIRSALEISIAGIFFGASLVMHPATIPTVLAAFFLWLFLGLHRSRATTLPSLKPEASVTFAWVGAGALAALTIATIVVLASLAGDSSRQIFGSFLPSGYAAHSWRELYRWLVSPMFETDLLVAAAFLLVAIIALMEWFAGTHWGAAGMLPWIYLLLFVLLTGTPETRIPLSIPPLLVLGLGWLALRGFSPARVRRQEYTFLLVWLVAGYLLFPIARAIEAHLTGEMGMETMASVSLTLLPMVLLVAARAGRAFWETEHAFLARAGILLFTCLPVLAGLAELIAKSPARFPGSAGLAIHLQRSMPIALGTAAALGALSVLVSVRPDQLPVPRPAGRGRDHPRRRRRHHRGARGHRPPPPRGPSS